MPPIWAISRSSGSSDWRRSLASKLVPPVLKPPACRHLVVGQRHLRHVVGELVGVPARLVVVAVHVDRAEDAERIGQRQFVLEGMAGQDRVALLDVDLDLLLQPEALEEAVDGRDVVVVLVLGRLLRLRLDQDRALEADPVLVVDDQAEEAAGLLAARGQGRC